MAFPTKNTKQTGSQKLAAFKKKTSNLRSAQTPGQYRAAAESQRQQIVGTGNISTGRPTLTQAQADSIRGITGGGLKVMPGMPMTANMVAALRRDLSARNQRIENRDTRISNVENRAKNAAANLNAYNKFIQNGVFTGTNAQYNQYKSDYQKYETLQNNYNRLVESQNIDVSEYNKNLSNLKSKTKPAAPIAKTLAAYDKAEKYISSKLPKVEKVEPLIRFAVENSPLFSPLQLTSSTRKQAEKIVQFNLGSYESVQKQPLKAMGSAALFFVGGIGMKGASAAAKALGAGARTARFAKRAEQGMVAVYALQSGRRVVLAKDARELGFVAGDIIFNEVLPAGLGLKYGIKVVEKLPAGARKIRGTGTKIIEPTKLKIELSREIKNTRRLNNEVVKNKLMTEARGKIIQRRITNIENRFKQGKITGEQALKEIRDIKAKQITDPYKIDEFAKLDRQIMELKKLQNVKSIDVARLPSKKPAPSRKKAPQKRKTSVDSTKTSTITRKEYDNSAAAIKNKNKAIEQDVKKIWNKRNTFEPDERLQLIRNEISAGIKNKWKMEDDLLRDITKQINILTSGNKKLPKNKEWMLDVQSELKVSKNRRSKSFLESEINKQLKEMRFKDWVELEASKPLKRKRGGTAQTKGIGSFMKDIEATAQLVQPKQVTAPITRQVKAKFRNVNVKNVQAQLNKYYNTYQKSAFLDTKYRNGINRQFDVTIDKWRAGILSRPLDASRLTPAQSNRLTNSVKSVILQHKATTFLGAVRLLPKTYTKIYQNMLPAERQAFKQMVNEMLDSQARELSKIPTVIKSTSSRQPIKQKTVKQTAAVKPKAKTKPKPRKKTKTVTKLVEIVPPKIPPKIPTRRKTKKKPLTAAQKRALIAKQKNVNAVATFKDLIG